MSRFSKPIRAGREESPGSITTSSSAPFIDTSKKLSASLSENDEEDSNTDLSEFEHPERLDNDEEDQDIHKQLRNISFGALQAAQISTPTTDLGTNGPPRKRKRSQHTEEDSEDEDRATHSASKVATLQARLAELKALKARKTSALSLDEASSITSTRTKAGSSSIPHRSSKHAPTAQPSNRPVTRRRTAISMPSTTNTAGDPRFSALQAGRLNESALRHNYAFLSEYRDGEIKELKTNLNDLKARAKKRKSGTLTEGEDAERERLQRIANSLGNKQKAEKARETEREVKRDWKRGEREAVREGRKSGVYYMKRGEVRRRVEEEKEKGMKRSDRFRRDKRREKKASQKEKLGLRGVRKRMED